VITSCYPKATKLSVHLPPPHKWLYLEPERGNPSAVREEFNFSIASYHVDGIKAVGMCTEPTCEDIRTQTTYEEGPQVSAPDFLETFRALGQTYGNIARH